MGKRDENGDEIKFESKQSHGRGKVLVKEKEKKHFDDEGERVWFKTGTFVFIFGLVRLWFEESREKKKKHATEEREHHGQFQSKLFLFSFLIW